MTTPIEVPADQPSAAPTPKLVAGTAGGAGMILLLWVANTLGLDIPTEVAEAIVLLAAGVVAYLKKNKLLVYDEPGQHEAS